MPAIQSVRPLLTRPDSQNLVIVKVKTSEPGLHVVGCGRPQHEVKRLANQILSYYRDHQVGIDDEVVQAPSERQLANKFGATRHAVRSAPDYLDNHGKIKRMSGRGSYALSNPAPSGAGQAEPGLRCINFIQAPLFQDAEMHWVVNQYLAGYTQVLEKHQVKTRFIFCSDDQKNYDDLLWDQAPWGQQGCVLVNRMVPGLMNWLNEQKVPFVIQYARLYESEQADIPHHRVYVNKIGGAAEATQHLLELGHRRIGYVGPFPKATVFGELCNPEFEGYCSALRSEGLPVHPQDLLKLHGELPSGAFEPCRRFLRHEFEFTALVTTNGGMTEGLLHATEAAGVDVPSRLSVIGFSGASASVCRPVSPRRSDGCAARTPRPTPPTRRSGWDSHQGGPA